jgi:predicted nucleic acid-binding protein
MLDEPDKVAIERGLTRFDRHVASRLLSVELRRVGSREDALEEANRILDNVLLIPLNVDVLDAAQTITPFTVTTLDAIHLATAVRLAKDGRLDAMMTYDRRLADGAREHGLEVLSPS